MRLLVRENLEGDFGDIRRAHPRGFAVPVGRVEFALVSDIGEILLVGKLLPS